MGKGSGEVRFVKGTNAARVARQHYADIKADCLARGVLFEDPDFPATGSSVYYSVPTNFAWMRPSQIVSDPHMFVGGASRFDIKQGDLGNCWFLAAVASLCSTKNQELLYRVVPRDNSFTKDYCGVFHFQFWQYGQWVDVVIDDRLPTNGGQLMFMHSAENNEFWSALLEKAYAKLNGSYEAMQGGASAEAMEDFTGGICEVFNFRKEVPPNLFSIMKKGYERDSMLGCTIDAQPGQIECVLDNGLVMGHAYSITGVREIDFRGRKQGLVRVRNPWGNQYEWKGAWADNSSEWKDVTEQQKKELDISKDDDGEFWMDFNDFTSNFDKMELCHMGPEAFGESTEGGKKKKWVAQFEQGGWKRRVNAGGCRNFLDTFWTNPQYRVEVVDADEDDNEDVGTIIVGLMQKERRKKRAEGSGDLLTMGYMLYKINDPKLADPNSGPLDLNFFKFTQATGRSAFSNMREVCTRHRLPPGNYAIVPCTFKPDQEGDFIMRIFSEKPAPAHEIDEVTGFIGNEEANLGVFTVEVEAQNIAMSQAPKEQPEQKEPQRRRRRDAAAPSTAPGTATSTVTIQVQATTQRIRLKANAVTEDDAKEEMLVRQVFKDTSGEDLEVDAYELRGILDEHFKKDMKLRPRFKFDGFSLECCRSLVAMKDGDQSGKLGYEEFKQLWGDMRAWKKVFKEFDTDDSGYFNSHELRMALNSVGYRVSNATFNCLVMRFSGPQGRIYFDDYILCVARLKTMFENFNSTSDGRYTLDSFVRTTMYS
jgi:calpain